MQRRQRTYSVDNHGGGGRGIMYSQREIDQKWRRREGKQKKKGGEEVFFSGGLWLVGEFALFVPIPGEIAGLVKHRLITWKYGSIMVSALWIEFAYRSKVNSKREPPGQLMITIPHPVGGDTDPVAHCSSQSL
jgi:hypothetical protein